MVIHCLSMLAGAYALALFAALPTKPVLYGCGMVAVMCVSSRRLRPVAFALGGFAVMGMAVLAQTGDRLAAELEGDELWLVVAVDDFVQADAASVRFVARPRSRDDLPQKLRLAWYQAPAVPRLGEVWHLQVRLRRPRGYANPGGFDFEGWLFRQGIGATGYVVGGEGNYRLHGERAALVKRLRRHVVDRIAARLPRDDAAAVLMAIGVGARHEISRARWDQYARTGTSHLMAISGLHIGLAAGSAYLLCWMLMAVVCRRRNLRDLSMIGAIVIATAYAALSGFAVPARRAILMAGAAGALVLCRKKARAGELLAIPCFGVFLSDPLTILLPGFKLSFAAVAILFFIAGQHVVPARVPGAAVAGRALTEIKRLVMMQLALLTGLFALTVLIFDRFTIVAPLVNLLVLPVFNFLTVPLTLAGMLLDGPLQMLGDRLLLYAHASVRLVLWIVAQADRPGLLSFRTASIAPVVLTLIPLLYLLLPPGWPARRIAIIAMLAVLCDRPAPPPRGCLDYYALDVGQGQAVLLRTRRHTLLFDTGPSYLSGGTTAELVVLPFLRHLGVERLDRVVISHADLDHAGGIRTVVAGVETGQVLVGERIGVLGTAQRPCLAGDRWDYDGVGFTVLHPRSNAPWTGNNSSCVLEVAVGTYRLLLAGDIEAPVEKLLAHQAALRKSSVVFVPHHGSRTSSSAALIGATRPDLAIVSASYRNRWGFPKEEIVRRWQVAGARVLNTATAGAISQRICRGSGAGPVRRERIDGRKFWHAFDAGAS